MCEVHYCVSTTLRGNLQRINSVLVTALRAFSGGLKSPDEKCNSDDGDEKPTETKRRGSESSVAQGSESSSAPVPPGESVLNVKRQSARRTQFELDENDENGGEDGAKANDGEAALSARQRACCWSHTTYI